MRTHIRTVFRISAAAAALGWSMAAAAQDAQADSADAAAPGEIVVTGSSLKGVAPVGSTLTTIGRAELEETGAQTVQQVLKTVPSVVGLQSAGQGSYGSADGAGTNAPTIHGLGASASNSTLILLNGHRLPVSGVNHVLADPNIIAPLAMERVEVLADGASSVYGSDAVAGVINFITRRNVNGFEATVQKGFGENYGTFNAGALWGKTWDTGSFLVSYNYSNRDNLAAADRSWARANQTARGGRNFTPNRCSPASITAGASTFYTPYTAAGTVAGDCDPSLYWDLLPSEKRHSVFTSVQQDVGDKLTVTADFIYSNRTNVQNVTRGSASGTIYNTGAVLPAGRSVNPFAGILATLPGAPTSATVNFNADQLLGTGATITGKAETFYGRLDAVYHITDAWDFNVGGLIGRDKAQLINQGQLNTAVFNLALNGFQSASINGVTQSVSQALTAANAIDVFGSGTSAATKALLTDNRQVQIGDQTIKNVYGKLSGDFFEMPGGMAKLAIGGEFLQYTLGQDIVRPNNLGIASANSAFLHIDYNRKVSSVYGEVFLPIIKDSFVKSFEVILSGRIDHYSDVGTTRNPKIAANLEVVDGVKFRSNWARSFVAPALTSRGSNAAGLTGESGFSGINGAGIPGGSPTILIANFPGITSVPGAVCGATSCTIGNVNGVLLTGGNGALKPQTGQAFSLGVDLTPRMIPGLSLSVTYWNNKLRGGITAPQGALALGAADLSYLLQLYPAGMTAAQIAAAGSGLPQTGNIAQPAYFTYNFQQNNVLNLNVSGLDVSAAYRIDTSVGRFDLGAAFSRKLKFDQFIGTNGKVFSVLGTAGFNTTFPSVKFEGRFNVGYSYEGISADVFVNHLGGYQNWSGSVANAVTRTNGVPTGGGDPVKSFTTVDLHLGYKLKNIAVMNEAQIFVDATNLFNTAPPQFNAFNTNGSVAYDNQNATPLGRVVTVGLRAKF
ncbi:MAG: TonB-dependent receptor [Sphingomonadales bacterium]|nr:TonB-dependent receptor [Sphingomonadales bacterium]